MFRVVVGFRLNSDLPDEAKQLTTDCGNDLRFVFSGNEQSSIAGMQTMLSLPGNLSDLRTGISLTFEQPTTKARSELIGPGGFDQNTSEMSITGFGDAALIAMRTAGIFPGYKSAVAHQLFSTDKARHVNNLSSESDRANLGNTTKRPQCVDDHSQSFGRCSYRIFNRLVQSSNAQCYVFNFVNIIAECGLQSRQFEVNGGLDPLQMMSGRGGLERSRPLFTVTQQKSAQSSASTLLIFAGGFACANEITQGFVGGVWYPTGSEIAGAMTTSELNRVASISLNFVTWSSGNESRRNHLALPAESSELPVEHIAGRTSFITSAEFFGRPEFLNQAPNRFFAVRNCAEVANFTIGFSNCNRDGGSVDIKTNKSYRFHDRLLSFVCGSVLLVRTTNSIARDTTEDEQDVGLFLCSGGDGATFIGP